MRHQMPFYTVEHRKNKYVSSDAPSSANLMRHHMQFVFFIGGRGGIMVVVVFGSSLSRLLLLHGFNF